MPELKFATIEKFLKLLTNDQWLLSKKEVKTQKLTKDLKRLTDELNNLNDKEKLTTLQGRIAAINKAIKAEPKENETTQNLDSSTSSTELEITKKTKLTREEAQLLFSNINLLEQDSIPDFKQECAKELRSLLFKDLLGICGTDFKPKRLQTLQHDDIKNLPIDVKKFIICIREMGFGLYSENIKKLETWFDNDEDRMKYLKAADYSSPEAFERWFGFELPDLSNISEDQKQFWHKLNAKNHIPSLKFFSDAHKFSTAPGFKKIVEGYLNDKQSSSKDTLTSLQQLLRTLKYKRGTENEQLSNIFSDNEISEPLFNSALDFINKNKGNVKTSDKLPNIEFNVTVGGKNYHFKKLPAGDYRGFILGKLTNCCQSLGDASTQCVEDGMTKENAGFYVVTDGDRVVAQSYAWLAEGNQLVWDSFESLGGSNNGELFVEVAKECHNRLQALETPMSLLVGTGGETPKIDGDTVQRPEQLVSGELYMYGDSSNVYDISQDISLSGSQESQNIPNGELSLFGMGIKDEGVKAIAEALKTNTTLTSLDFGGNKIGDEGAKAIAEVLQTNKTLTSPNLSINNIGDEGAKAIAEALKTNTTLTSLNLGQNKIGDEGAKAIAEVLKTNTTLTSLNLSFNNIGYEGVKALVEALKENTTLTSIDLTSIDINNYFDFLYKISNSLRRNKLLKALSDPQISVTDSDLGQLLKLYYKNAYSSLDQLSTLVKNNINKISTGGNTLLSIAEHKGYKDLVATLLQDGASNNVQQVGSDLGSDSFDSHEWNHIVRAHQMVQNNKEELKAMLESMLTTIDNVNINQQDDSGGLSPLHLAAYYGFADITEKLLEKGADINIQNFKGQTALDIAVYKWRVALVELLFKKGADVNMQDRQGQTALDIAVSEHSFGLAKLLLENGADVNIQNEDGNTALHIALDTLDMGNFQLVELLLEKGVDVNIQNNQGQTALQIAIGQDQFYVIKKILENISETDGNIINKPDSNGWTPLHLAAFYGFTDITEKLLGKKADINIQNFERQTALDIAVSKRNVELVKLLLENGAAVNDATYHIIERGMPGYLIQMSLINKIADDGMTQLGFAAFAGNVKFAEQLLLKGADVNMRDRQGQTALHIAVSEGNVELVELLFKKGVDVNIQNNQAQTALQIEDIKHPNKNTFIKTLLSRPGTTAGAASSERLDNASHDHNKD